MNTTRSDPDTILHRLHAGQSTRGHLKIYLGMAAGVGKTFAMLSDAIAEKQRGVDIVGGYIEAHGRIATQQLAEQIERLPLCARKHRDITLHEFDLDQALARHPKVLVIDELAHTNAPGSRHTKRWQDVEECLENGIDVFTTLNVQHVESLRDVVSRITGVVVQETVPDRIVREADQIELVDTPPEELIQRLRDGKVYASEKIDTAINNFFTPGNLIALRELVLRLAAERVDQQLTTFRRQNEINQVWPATPRVLVCVAPNPMAERVVRAAGRLAHSMQAEIVALTIERPEGLTASSDQSEHLDRAIELATRLGARVVRRTAPDIVSAILHECHELNAHIVVVGRTVRSRLREYLFGSLVDELIRSSGEIEVHVLTDRSSHSSIPMLVKLDRPSAGSVLKATLLTVVATAVCGLADRVLAPPNLVMFYLLAVAWSGAKWGRAESVVTAVLSVLAFDFFFVPPRGTFAVADLEYLVMFVVMLTVALLIGSLTQRLRAQALLVSRRERRTASLFEFSKHLTAVSSIPDIARVVHAHGSVTLGREAVLFIPHEGQLISILDRSDLGLEHDQNELAVVRWVSDNLTVAGHGTDTLAGAKATYVPISTAKGPPFVLGYGPASAQETGEDGALIEAVVREISSALDRLLAELHATRVAVDVERERVRNVLLSSVSHDFRTPLSAIAGAVDTVLAKFPPAASQAVELLQSVRVQTDSLVRLVRNVLDLTRLESGELTLTRDWESVEELLGASLERTAELLTPRRIHTSISNDVPLLKVDATSMVQVFINLFENIAKHTPENTEVFIDASCTGQMVMVSIRDSGPGLPAGSEARVFEKSFRGASSGESFGLGLTICKTIVEAHGGTIAAQNSPKGGATFVIMLPIPHEAPEVRDVTR